MQMTRSSFAAGHFELQVDGLDSSAYVRMVEGGWSKATPSQTGKARDFREPPRITTVDIDPISFEFGLTGATDMLRWVKRAWSGQLDRRNGQISYANFDMSTMLEHWFYDAMITNVEFPTLDGSSKDGGYVKCTLQPAHAHTKLTPNGGPRIQGTVSTKQKMWTPSAFRLTIDGIPGMEYTNKIDAIKVAIDTSSHYTGEFRLPEIEPRKVIFPDLEGTISMAYGAALHGWYEDFIRSSDGGGTQDNRAIRQGSIDFLTPDRSETMFSINLINVIPLAVSADQAKANDPAIRRLKFKLWVGKMELMGSRLLGFY